MPVLYVFGDILGVICQENSQLPWGSGGLNTHDLLALTLDDSSSSVCPDDLEWVLLVLLCMSKGELFSMFSKSKSFLCTKEYLLCTQNKILCIHVYLQQTVP